MSFLDNLISRYNDIDDAPAPTATDAVRHDRFDQASWEDVRKDVPAIGNMVEDLGRKHDYVEDFARDFFNLTHKGDPELRDRGDMKPTHQPNNAMINEFARMPEVQHLRSLTANDQYGAAMAMLSMKEKLQQAAERMSEARKRAEEQERAQQEAREAAEAARQALDEAQAAQEALDQLGEDADENARAEAEDAAREAEHRCGGLVTKAEHAAGAAQQAQQATQGATGAAVAGMRAEVRQAANEAAQEREAEDQLMKAFGVEDGELKRMSFKERATLAKKLKGNRLAKFAKLIGQFKAMQAAESRRRVTNAADEVIGVELGDDLTRLSTQEFTNLASDELEDDFWLRYVDRQLLVKKLRGTERMGQGPIIAVVDESGSMEAEDVMGGSREAWSKAFALALCEQARKQKRDFHYIGFSSSGQQWHLVFPEGKAPISKVIEMTEHFWGGGTNYERPLRMALDIVEGDYEAKSLPKPDIVFVTDDEYGSLDEAFMSRWNGLKAKLSLRCFGIGMGISGGHNGALAAISDNVRVISQLTSDPRAVADVFRTV